MEQHLVTINCIKIMGKVLTDITLKAGIVFEGFGLSVTPLDINKDQWIDLYITNDYLTNDLLYINQKDGTFKNEVQNYLMHQSKLMGSDASDFNHDGYTDLISLDMLERVMKEENYNIKEFSFRMYSIKNGAIKINICVICYLKTMVRDCLF